MVIWQHVEFENEAAIGEWAKKRNIPFRIIRCWENEPLEADDLLVVLGGPMSAYDEIPFIKNEISFLQQRIADGGKIFGVCLGAQLVATAMGAAVYPGTFREAGWRNVTITSHHLSEGLNESETVFHWHGDTFDLPERTVCIASNDAYENQAFATPDGDIVATQFHFETTLQSMEAILSADGEYLQSSSPYVSDAETIRSGVSHISRANQALFHLLDQWAALKTL